MKFGAEEIIGTILIPIAFLICNSIGLNGAEILLPIIKIMFDFQQKDGVVLMQPAMFAAVLIRFLVIFNERHIEFKNQRKIDVKFTSIMVPLVFIGCVYGEILHKVFSRVIETTIFSVFIAYIFIHCLLRARGIFREKVPVVYQNMEDEIVYDSEDIMRSSQSSLNKIGKLESQNSIGNNIRELKAESSESQSLKRTKSHGIYFFDLNINNINIEN